MTTIEKASYINSMPYEMFKELLSDQESAKKALKAVEEIMPAVNDQRPYEKRGQVRNTINQSFLLTCIRGGQSTLTTKMVSLNILFANPIGAPDYFDELKEMFTTEGCANGTTIINYEKLANIYGTTVDNVKSNILFNNYKQIMAKLSTKETKNK